jgi:hypothetical protein
MWTLFCRNYCCCSCSLIQHTRVFTFLVSPLYRSSQQSNAILYSLSESPGNLFASKQITKCCGRKRLDANTTPFGLTELCIFSAVRSRTSGGPQRQKPVP